MRGNADCHLPGDADKLKSALRVVHGIDPGDCWKRLCYRDLRCGLEGVRCGGGIDIGSSSSGAEGSGTSKSGGGGELG